MRRLARALLGVVLGLALLEGSLQLAALAVGASTGRSGEAGQGSALTILCVGDSHTYGWQVDAEDAWPARLERLLGGQGLDARVVNCALPGKNTRNVLEELPEYCERWRPDLVLVQAGLNNPYSRPEAAASGARAPWYEGLRLVKLFAIMRRRAQHVEPVRRLDDPSDVGEELREVKLPDGRTEVRMLNREGEAEAFQIGGGTIGDAEVELAVEWIAGDLIAIQDLAAEHGARMVALTYAAEAVPGEYIPPCNRAIRLGAERGSIPLVDVARGFGPYLARYGAERLLLPDLHPRRDGYSIVARLVYAGLRAQGLVAGADLGLADAEIAASAAAQAELELVPAAEPGGRPRFRARFEPGTEYTVVFARATGSSRIMECEVPLATDELTKAVGIGVAGPFGPDGTADVELPDAVWAAIGEQPAWAVLVARSKIWQALDVSAAVRIQ